MRVMTGLLILIFMGLTLVGCSYAAGGNVGKNKPPVKGARKEMKTYHIGRFAIDVPIEFQLAQQRHDFRLVEIEEIPVPPDQAPGKYAEQRWKERLSEIAKLDKPEGVNEIVIKQQNFSDLHRWSRGVLYYHDYMTVRRGAWEIWVDYGNQITVFNLIGLIRAQDSMLTWMKEVIQAYRPTSAPGVSNAFCTRMGAIDLPYKRQESSYARFNGPLQMVLEIEMNEIHGDSAKTGIINRTIAAMAGGLANGMAVKKIRSKNRTAAGLTGEEEILQGDYQQEQNVSFDWEYLGASESGDKPMIQITMDTLADNLTEKIGVWDSVLSSFRSCK